MPDIINSQIMLELCQILINNARYYAKKVFMLELCQILINNARYYAKKVYARIMLDFINSQIMLELCQIL